MRISSLALLIIALVSLPAFAQRKARRPATAKEAAAPMTDQQFVDFAGQTDMTEANLGQVAQEKGDAAVQAYGKMLRSDHTSDYDQLTAAAQKASLTTPTGIDAENNRTIDELSKLKGKAFDERFTRAMISGHEHAIAVYTKEEQDAQSPDLKTYAQQALPVLQKHLDAARQLEKPHRK